MMRSRKVSCCEPYTTIKVVLLGQEGVGKSALAVRFLTKRFIGEYDSSLESTCRHFLEIDNQPLCMDLRDTAGECTVKKLHQSVQQGDVFIILYSITARSSFIEAKRTGYSISRYRTNNGNLPFIALVATKTDLEHFRAVDKMEGVGLAKELGCSFFEVSVSDSDGYKNVTCAMHTILKAYLRRDGDAVTKRVSTRRISSGWYLSKMKEGIIKRTGAITRRKSVVF